MKKTHLFILVTLVGVSNLSMVRDSAWEILTGEDYDFARSESDNGPALTSLLDGKSPYWESFNEWQCFSSDEILHFECMSAEYGEIRKVPALHVLRASHLYEFSMDPDPKPDCDKIIQDWKNLLDGESAFCAYAARLEDLEADAYTDQARDGSVWMINRLKTRKGYWKFETDSNWMSDSP